MDLNEVIETLDRVFRVESPDYVQRLFEREYTVRPCEDGSQRDGAWEVDVSWHPTIDVLVALSHQFDAETEERICFGGSERLSDLLDRMKG